jgi:cyclic pyranopterin monophosphate synthase
MTTPHESFNSSNANLAARSLTHVNESGEAKMVDVGAKQESKRTAIATSRITMSAEAAIAIRSDSLKKGDCVSVARIAAIQAVSTNGLRRWNWSGV